MITEILADIIVVYRRHKELADGALIQIDDTALFHTFGERSHAIAVIVKHVAGNLRSRWTDFLATDGDKPDRNRDGEFLITPGDSRTALMASWERSWQILFDSLSALTPDDFGKTVHIRNEPHTVYQAIHRSLAHTAYHVGQLTYLCRLLAPGEWKWLTVAPKPITPVE